MLPFNTLVVNLMSELKLKFLDIRYLSSNFLIQDASVSLFVHSYSNKKCEKKLLQIHECIHKGKICVAYTKKNGGLGVV